jgi:hypothetical protein
MDAAAVCSACTLSNPAHATVCEACRTPLGSAGGGHAAATPQAQLAKPTSTDFRFSEPLDVQLPPYRLSNDREKTCYINATVFALFALRMIPRPLRVLRERQLEPGSVWLALTGDA